MKKLKKIEKKVENEIEKIEKVADSMIKKVENKTKEINNLRNETKKEKEVGKMLKKLQDHENEK